MLFIEFLPRYTERFFCAEPTTTLFGPQKKILLSVLPVWGTLVCRQYLMWIKHYWKGIINFYRYSMDLCYAVQKFVSVSFLLSLMAKHTFRLTNFDKGSRRLKFLWNTRWFPSNQINLNLKRTLSSLYSDIFHEWRKVS